MSGLVPGSEVELTVEKPVAGGRMLARLDGRIIFVAGAIPGERVRARIDRIARQLAFADVTDVLEPSTDRRPSTTDWACGGSLYAHVAYPRQLALKSELVADAFQRIAKISLPSAVPVTGSEERGYRMRARLHARDGRFGFFREGTHELCDAGATGQLLQSTIDAVSRLERVLSSNGVEGAVACELSENIQASERVALVELHQPPPEFLPSDAIEGLTGLVLSDHQGLRARVVFGSPYVAEHLETGGVQVELIHHVQSFFQGNRYLVVPLLSAVLRQVADGPVVDLYAGVGLFAVSLAATGRKEIVAVEGDHASARDLEGNAGQCAGSIAVEHLSVERYLQRRQDRQPRSVILDPPRTGMSREAADGLLQLKPPSVIYVSCDLATLARDVRRLVESGYRLTHIEAFDLFPNTAHVETLVVLSL